MFHVIQDNSKWYKFTCKHCQSVFAFNEKELVWKKNNGGGYAVTCPCCAIENFACWSPANQLIPYIPEFKRNKTNKNKHNNNNYTNEEKDDLNHEEK